MTYHTHPQKRRGLRREWKASRQRTEKKRDKQGVKEKGGGGRKREETKRKRKRGETNYKEKVKRQCLRII